MGIEHVNLLYKVFSHDFKTILELTDDRVRLIMSLIVPFNAFSLIFISLLELTALLSCLRFGSKL